MTLISLKTIKELCKKYGIYPAKTRGQNFLISQKVVAQVIQAADLKKDDIVLEIGPGLGVITQELAKRVKKVIAVEIDKKMVRALQEILVDYKNVEVVQEDILKINIRDCVYKKCKNMGRSDLFNETAGTRSDLAGDWPSYKIVANIPFNITGQVLRKFLSREPKPSLMVLILQKEVAERIVARPGKMGFLSVMVQFFAKPEIVSRVRPGSFWPQPDVDSAIVKIILKGPTFLKDETFQKSFFKVVRAGFSSPRKKLVTNLASQLKREKEKILAIFQKLGLNPQARAQELSVDDWVKLAKLLR